MNDVQVWLLILGVVVTPWLIVAVVLLIVSLRRRRRRHRREQLSETLRREAEQWALEHGWDYLDEAPDLVGLGASVRSVRELTAGVRGQVASAVHEFTGGMATAAGRLPAVLRRSTGRPDAACHAVRGEFRGASAMSWNHSYWAGVEAQDDRRRQGITETSSPRLFDMRVVALELAAELPPMRFMPEPAEDREGLGRGLGFESEQFNRTWRVHAVDQRLAHALIHPRMMELLMRLEMQRAYRITGRHLMTWRRGTQEVAQIETDLERLSAIRELIPAHLVDPSR